MADGLLNKASIILTPTGYKAGTLYNVAPVVEPYEDFDFVRASVASRVNSSGLVEMVGRTLSSELVTNGDFATDSDWNKGSGWSISGGEAISIGGANFASLNQEIGATSGKTYKVIFTISEYTSGQLFLNIQGSSITYTSADTFTAYVVAGGSRLYFVSGSGSNQFIGKIDNVSVKEIIDTNNIPRISYDSNGNNGHILLEPTSTNLITYSEDFSQWTKTGGTTVSATNILSPSGENNGTNITGLSGSGGNDLKFFPSSFNSASKTLTVSVYLKGSGTLRVQMSNGVDQGFDDTITLSSNWTRYTLTATFNSTNSGNFFNVNIDDSGATATSYDIWGAQLEELSYATSYIPTLTGSTVTRATETATGAGSAELINSTEGVLYAEIAALADDLTNRQMTLSDGSDNNRIVLKYDNQSNVIQAFNRVGGVETAFLSASVTDIKLFSKCALKYKVNDYALWIDGIEVATDTSSTTFSSSTLNDFKFGDSGGSSNFYGKCKALAVFNEALSDDELNNLTG